jgi:hypothetical protein
VLDEYTVAYRDRRAVLAPQRAKLINNGGGILKPIMVLDGQVVGSWRRTFTASTVKIVCASFNRLPSPTRPALERAAARVAHFFDLKLLLES